MKCTTQNLTQNSPVDELIRAAQRVLSSPVVRRDHAPHTAAETDCDYCRLRAAIDSAIRFTQKRRIHGYHPPLVTEARRALGERPTPPKPPPNQTLRETPQPPLGHSHQADERNVDGEEFGS